MDRTTATRTGSTAEVESDDLSKCTASDAVEITLRLRIWTKTASLTDEDAATMAASAGKIDATCRIDHEDGTVVLERAIPNQEPPALRIAALAFTVAVADEFLAYGPLSNEIFPNHGYHVIDGGKGIELHYDT